MRAVLEGCVSVRLMEGAGNGRVLVLVGVGQCGRLAVWNALIC